MLHAIDANCMSSFEFLLHDLGNAPLVPSMENNMLFTVRNMRKPSHENIFIALRLGGLGDHIPLLRRWLA